MNNYIVDGVRNLRRVSNAINREMNEEEIEDSTLFFAFGMERICKGLLFEISPSFILDVNKFPEVVNAFYLDRVIDTNSSELKAVKKVAFSSFRDLINRSSHFHVAVKTNKDILNNLREHGNVLIHGAYQKFEHKKIQQWLIGVYFPVVSDILKETGVDAFSVFDGREVLLKKLAISAKHDEEIQKRVLALLEASRIKWESLENDSHVRISARKTTADIEQPRSHHDNAYYPYPCPACANTAVLEAEPDFDYADGAGYISRVYPTEVRCHYCGLIVSDYEDVSFLAGNDWWEKTLHEESQS